MVTETVSPEESGAGGGMRLPFDLSLNDVSGEAVVLVVSTQEVVLNAEARSNTLAESAVKFVFAICPRSAGVVSS